MKNNRILMIVFTLMILPVIIFFLTKNFFQGSYILSSFYKIIFLFPLFFGIFIEKKTLKKSLFQDFDFKTFKSNFFILLGIGILFAFIYFIAFLIFRDFISLEEITSGLKDSISLNITNLIFIGAYIIFINSLLEEYFWRGFIFKKLSDSLKPLSAYLLSGIAFSFHHIMFYYNWFSPLFFILVTLGLVFYAMIMNFIFNKYKDLFSCWFVHIFADIAQIAIAFIVITSV